MRLLDHYTRPQLARLLERATPEQREAILPAVEAELFEEDPALWGKVKLKEFWWSKQREIAESVRDNRRTAVRSCHGPGKSFMAARIACWWLDTHPPGTAFVATSAPTGSQVRAILWREINKAHRKGGLIGRVNQVEWLIGNELIGFGRKPANPAEAGEDETITAFQGIHAQYVLVVLDEACGIPEALWAAALSLITNSDSHILAIGNPDDPSSHFKKVCDPGSRWNVIGISIFDTPNFTDEEVPDQLRRILPSQEWLEDARNDWGEDSNIYTSKALGVFPTDVSDAVIPYSWASQCRYLDFMVNPDDLITLGVDVGAGGDLTVITGFQSRRFMDMPNRPGPNKLDTSQWRSRHDDPMRCVSEILEAIRMTGAKRVNIDAVGVGWAVAGSVAEKCNARGWKIEVNPVQVSEQSSEPEKYWNLRAEMWWKARLAIHAKQWDMSVLDDRCIAELTTPKYTDNADTNGKILLEKTERIVERLGRSPDSASSALLAAVTPVRPKPITAGRVHDRRLSRRR